MKFTYLLIDFFVMIVPFLFSFHPKIRFDRMFKFYFAANLLSALVFIAWDVYFTSRGIWRFNDKYITGVKFFNLPVEEVLFFFCIPFACIFTYYCLGEFFHWKLKDRLVKWITIGISILLLTLGFVYWRRDYTMVTFFSTALLLLFVRFVFNVKWLGRLYPIYCILLLPFFIVNGILTGTTLAAPIVWYSDDQIISLRIATIPIEDIFYGFEMILLTVFFYHLLQFRWNGASGNIKLYQGQ